MIRVVDLCSCIGLHKDGLDRVGGFRHVLFCEADPWRRDVLARRHPGTPIHDDVRTLAGVDADFVFAGPPCQTGSVAAAVHGYRTGDPSLAYQCVRVGVQARAEWIVLEQPTGNSGWEANVSQRLAYSGYHVARLEFEARDVGAPYPRRRVYLLACPSLPRLEVAWREGPRAIERVARAADARGAWDPDQLASLPVDARSAGEHDRGPMSRERKAWIEALGDSNPPGMAEVIAHCVLAGHAVLAQTERAPGKERGHG